MRVYVHPKLAEEYVKFDIVAIEKLLAITKYMRLNKGIARSEYRSFGRKARLFELRIRVRSGIYRALGGKINDGKAVVVFFQKKTRKTPAKFIRLAEKRLADYRQL